MEMHLLDNTELDVDSFHAIMPTRYTPPGGVAALPTVPASGVIASPLGVRSQNVVSVPAVFTFWHPNAQNSGITIQGSQNLPLGTGAFHVKGSDPSGNSDVDAEFRFWNIWHVTGDPTFNSQVIALQPSDRVWVTSNINTIQQLHSSKSAFLFQPAGPIQTTTTSVPYANPTPFQPNAHWLHLTMTVPFHLTVGDQSVFYATFLNTATLGVEHVPEPASAALIGLGLAAVATSRTVRRRRVAT